MGEIITRQADRRAPAPAAPEIAHLAAVLRNKIEIDGTTRAGRDLCSISSENAPTDRQRAALDARRHELVEAMKPRPQDTELVVDMILEMFYSWSDTRRMDATKVAATASKYASCVSEMPLWAVQKACDQLSNEDRDFPPSSGTLRAVAFKACDQQRQELADLDRTLSAVVYTPTPKGEEAVRRVREAADSLRSGKEPVFPPRERDTRLRSSFDDSKGPT